MSKKRIRQLEKAAAPYGYTFEGTTKGGHLRFVGPGGVVFASATASCHHADKNFISDVRRAARLCKELGRKG